MLCRWVHIGHKKGVDEVVFYKAGAHVAWDFRKVDVEIGKNR